MCRHTCFRFLINYFTNYLLITCHSVNQRTTFEGRFPLYTSTRFQGSNAGLPSAPQAHLLTEPSHRPGLWAFYWEELESMRSVSSPGEKAQWTCLKGRSGEKRTRLQSPGTKPRPRPCLSQIATCSSQNGNPVPNITWYRNGQQLKVPMELNTSEPSGAKGNGGWGGGWWQGLVTSSCCLPLSQMVT